MRQTRAASPRDPWIRHFDTAASYEDAEQRRIHIAAATTLVLHAVFFALRLPESPRAIPVPPVVIPFELNDFRPRPPQPPQPQPETPEPTPAEVVEPTIVIPGPPEIEILVPEPVAELPLTELLASIEPIDIVVPTAPPPAPRLEPVPYDPSIEKPVRLYSPLPPYTPVARQARRQGRMVLEAVIDETGRVVDLKVLKGLGMGLDQSALKTIATWRFEPARRKGRPIPVIYNLEINFRLS